MGRVLIIRFSSLGDIVLTYPSLQYLGMTGKEVHVLTKESYRELFNLHPAIHKIHSISDHAPLREYLQKLLDLRRHYQFEVVYDLHRNLRSQIARLILPGKFYKIKKFRFREFMLYFLHQRFYRVLNFKPIQRAQHAFQVVTQKDQKLPPSQISPDFHFELNHHISTKIICICVESAWASKQWDLDRFIACANLLQAQAMQVIWVGLYSNPRFKEVRGSINLAGKLSISQTAGLLKKTKLLVCNDSGLMHLAEAVGTPVVAIFGPTSHELGFGPQNPYSKVIEANLWCRPCSKTGRWCIRPIHQFKCLSAITVNQAYSAITEVLGVLK